MWNGTTAQSWLQYTRIYPTKLVIGICTKTVWNTHTIANQTRQRVLRSSRSFHPNIRVISQLSRWSRRRNHKVPASASGTIGSSIPSWKLSKVWTEQGPFTRRTLISTYESSQKSLIKETMSSSALRGTTWRRTATSTKRLGKDRSSSLRQETKPSSSIDPIFL